MLNPLDLFSREGKSGDSFVRYIQVMPTFQLGPRCQLELGGAPPDTHGGLAWGPRNRAGRDPEKSVLYAIFKLGANAPLAKEFALRALRLCARARDRRQTLVLGTRLAIANVLATSYCNLAPPLVCLDLLGHVELIIFRGATSREVFEARDSGQRPIRADFADQIFC